MICYVRVAVWPRDRLLCGSRGFFTLSHSVHSPGARGDCGDGLRSLAALPRRWATKGVRMS